MVERREARRQAQRTAQRIRAHGAPQPGIKQAETIPPWEWVVALFGLVLVLGSFGFTMYQVIAGDTSPPDITLHAEAIMPAGNSYLVQIRVRNRGGSTAAQLVIEGALTHDSGGIETSETILDYVPAHSYRIGGLFFTHDPRQFLLQLRAKGYVEP